MWAKNKQIPGFTIVELLIVIVVIGILAAITIVSFNGVQNKANDAAIQADFATIAKKLEVYKTTISTSSQYPPRLTTAELGVSVSRSAYGNNYMQTGDVNGYNLLYCVGVNADTYAVVARSRSGKTFAITNAKSLYESTTTLRSSSYQCGAEGIGAGYSAVWGFTEASGWTSPL